MEEKRLDVNSAVGMGETILSVCHPDCVTTIKHWITIIRARFEEVSRCGDFGFLSTELGCGGGRRGPFGSLWGVLHPWNNQLQTSVSAPPDARPSLPLSLFSWPLSLQVLTWAKQHQQRLEAALLELVANAELLEELLAWIQWAEATLIQREQEPQNIEQVKALIAEHQVMAVPASSWPLPQGEQCPSFRSDALVTASGANAQCLAWVANLAGSGAATAAPRG